MSDTMQADYWFLRENGVSTFTALRMIGMAYFKKKEEVVIKLPRENK